MSQAKHTPGPLMIRFTALGGDDVSGQDINEVAFIHVTTTSGKSVHMKRLNVTSKFFKEEFEEALANAQLIAAAPELLEALEQSLVMLSELGYTLDKCPANSPSGIMLAKFNEAINKARGLDRANRGGV